MNLNVKSWKFRMYLKLKSSIYGKNTSKFPDFLKKGKFFMRRNNYNYGFSKYGKNTSKFPDFALWNMAINDIILI